MVWQSDEFKSYWLIVTLLAIIVTIGIYYSINTSLEKAFRDGLFQIVSIITTTGFVTADYTSWSSGLTALFFILMFLGACAGSTSGGIKIIRHLVFIKNSYLEFKRILHPKAIVPLKLNNRVVAPRIMTHIIIFLLLYLISFVTGSVIVAFMGLDIVSAVGAVATSLGNVGPGLGIVGPFNNFSELSEPILLFLSFLMLLGRLELYTILVLFTPYFWKSN